MVCYIINKAKYKVYKNFFMTYEHVLNLKVCHCPQLEYAAQLQKESERKK